MISKSDMQFHFLEIKMFENNVYIYKNILSTLMRESLHSIVHYRQFWRDCVCCVWLSIVSELKCRKLLEGCCVFISP